jgi:hypothetical protein
MYVTIKKYSPTVLMDGKRGVFFSVSGLEESRVNKCTAFLDRKRSSGSVM